MAKRLEIAITGPDNVGKDSIAEYIYRKFDVELIEATSFRHSSSLAIRTAGRISKGITAVGDKLNSKSIASIGYAADLMLFYIARHIAKKPVVYIRYPPVDFEVYRDSYMGAADPLKNLAESVVRQMVGDIENIDTLIYLHANPKTIIQRINGATPQLHEKEEDLERIVAGYESTLLKMDRSIELVYIDTERLGLENVLEEIDGILAEKIAKRTEKTRTGWKEKIRFVASSLENLHVERTNEYASYLYERGIIKSNPELLEKRIEDSSYITKHLLAHAAIGISTIPMLFPGITDIVSSLGKESYSISWLAYELKNKNHGRAAIHFSVIPFCWIPRIGALSYLLPLAAKDPEAALVNAYALSKLITRKNPEELWEFIGTLPPSKLGVKAYNISKAHYVFDAFGSMANYSFSMSNPVRRKITFPIHSYLKEKSHFYRNLDEKFQNLKYTTGLVWKEIVAPSFMKGAKS